MGIAGILHNAGDIRKVQINKAGILDEVRNAGYSLTKNIVGDFKRICQSDLLVGRVLQAVVGDDQKGVNLAEQFLDADIRLIHPAFAFKLKGLRDDADRQRTVFTGNVGNRRGRAGTGAAAHAGGNEHHVGAFQCSGNGISAFFSSTSADLGIGTCALTAGDFFTDLDFLICIRNGKRLLVGIDSNKLDTLGAVLHHTVYDVVAGSANTNDFYCYNIFRTSFGLKIHNLCLLSDSTTQIARNFLSL